MPLLQVLREQPIRRDQGDVYFALSSGEPSCIEELIALHHASDVALVTPLRDGMNLVAKEYCAAHRGRAGVLVLSELAGASQELPEAELVNPYHIDGMADALERTRNLPEPLRLRRMNRLNDRIARADVFNWIDTFLRETTYAD